VPLRVAEVVDDYSEDGGADEVLSSVGVAVEDAKDAMICAFPDHRVHGDDGGGEKWGTPVRGEVDDPRYQTGVEQHVAREVPVDQLVMPAHGLE
jgi:hypothetical protein